MDNAIEQANRHLGSNDLFWTPCSGHNHSKNIGYCIVWASDKRTMGYAENVCPAAYLITKAPISHCIKCLADSNYLAKIIDVVYSTVPPKPKKIKKK